MTRVLLSKRAGVALGTLLVLAAEPALAQGAAAPFQQGLSILGSWVFLVGIFIAIVAFVVACIFLFLRNVLGAAGAFLFVVVGGALMANAASILSTLTGLTATGFTGMQ